MWRGVDASFTGSHPSQFQFASVAGASNLPEFQVRFKTKQGLLYLLECVKVVTQMSSRVASRLYINHWICAWVIVSRSRQPRRNKIRLLKRVMRLPIRSRSQKTQGGKEASAPEDNQVSEECCNPVKEIRAPNFLKYSIWVVNEKEKNRAIWPLRVYI